MLMVCATFCGSVNSSRAGKTFVFVAYAALDVDG